VGGNVCCLYIRSMYTILTAGACDPIHRERNLILILQYMYLMVIEYNDIL
jgi:hypothetical protein